MNINILDRYVLKKFLTTLLAAIIAWLALFIIVDMVEHLDAFLSNKAPVWKIIKYYVMYAPYCMILTMPISVLISVLFSLGVMAQHNEIVAMQAAGVSLYRIIGWLLMLGFFISLTVGITGETLVPKLNKERLDFLRHDIKKRTHYSNKNNYNVVVKDKKNVIFYISRYYGAKKVAQQVTIIWQDDLKNIQKRVDATRMNWDIDNQEWNLVKPKLRIFSQNTHYKNPESKNDFSNNHLVNDTLVSSTEMVNQLADMKYKPQYAYPKNLVELQMKQEEMSFAELFRFIKRIEAMGLSAHKWLTDLNMKLAHPLTNLIVLLIGAPLAARKRRSGVAIGMIIAFVISFIYFFFIRIGQVLGHKEVMNPYLAAWLGNIVFTFVGLIILIRIRK